MNENLKRKLMGKRFYSIYRRVRFIRYKNKLEKKKQLENKILKEETFAKKKLATTTATTEKKRDRGNLYKTYRKIRFLYRRRKSKKKEKSALIKEQIAHAKEEHLDIKKRLVEKRILDKVHKKEQKLQQKVSKIEKKKRRKRLLRYFLKRGFLNFIVFMKTIDKRTSNALYNTASSFVRNKEKRSKLFKISINSLSLFLLSYLVIYSISLLFTLWIASSFDYNTILFYYKIYYNIDTGDWTADSVKILYSIAPLTGLLFGIVSLIIFSTFRNERGILKLFFLWAFIHGMIMFFGDLLMGALLNKNFGWVISYLYFRDTGKMIFTLFSIFALVALGGFTAKSFLISGNTYLNYVDKTNKRLLLWGQVIIPVVIGSIVIILLKIPNNLYFGTEEEAYFETFKFSTILLFLIPLVVSFQSFNETYFDEEERKIKISWKFLAVVIFAILALRFGLSTGVHFG
ncbi:MAG: hypothetical protein DRJ05_08125 [Bacteroidetes bacterium]|nr:MAG: hypothetical protein DRJ05_08125 [Bacteroidota bacterium]